MKTSHKVVLLLLSLLMLGFLLTGCGTPEYVQKQLADLRAQQQSWEREKLSLESEITKLKEERVVLQNQMNKLEKELADFKAQLAKEDQLQKLEKEVSDLRSQLTKLSKDLENLSAAWQQWPYYPPYPVPYPSPYPSPYYPDSFTAYVYRGENFDQYVGSFTESTIDHYWSTSGPLGLTDYFSVRWVGSVWFEAGDYRFKVTVDDGVRLYVDGNLLIDRWTRRYYSTTYQATTYLSRGYHEVRLEYFDSTGEAVIRLNWVQTS